MAVAGRRNSYGMQVGVVMRKLFIYPAFSDPAQCADVFSRILWYFAPYDRYLESVTAFGPFQEVPLDIPSYIDEAAVTSEASKKVIKKVGFEAAPETAEAWHAALAEADRILVWRQPESIEGDPFGSAKALREAFGAEKVRIADEERMNTAPSQMLLAALSLMTDEEERLAESRRKLDVFKQRITLPVGYVFGTGPSLEEAWRYDYSDGHCIVCNSIVKNAALLDKLKPIALMASDPIFHAGPSTYAKAFRQSLVDCMAERDFHLFVPWRDYEIYLNYLPEKFHERIIGVPLFSGDDYNLDLERRFSVLGLPNVLTLLLLPVAATFFDYIGISGCDGRPISQDSYFWGHHKASQFGDQMDAIQRAHPGFFSISYNDYYLNHCAELERVCRAMEQLGKHVNAVTGSFIPALRKRGAAEPMQPPKGGSDEKAIILSIAPDLKNRDSSGWRIERLLGDRVEAKGHRFAVAASMIWSHEAAEGKAPAEDQLTVSARFSLGTEELLTRLRGKTGSRSAVHRKARWEIRHAVEGALLSTEGRVHAYMRRGSLEYAGMLYEIARENPRLSVEVTLAWLGTTDIWKPNFLKRWMWLLSAADSDARLRLTCETEHLSRQIEARSGIFLDVAAVPSERLDDEQAARLIEMPRPERSDARERVYFPGLENGAASEDHSKEIARVLFERMGKERVQNWYRDPPAAQSQHDDFANEAQRVEADLSAQDYMEWLSSCSAVVLPHAVPDYADRTTGLAVDSLFAGVPFVAQRGTSLAVMAERFGCGTVIDEGRPEEFVEAVERLLSRSNEAARDLGTAGQSYLAGNSWSGHAKSILANIPTEETGPLVPAAAEDERIAVPLIGPIPRDQAGMVNEAGAIQALFSTLGLPIEYADLLDRSPDALALLLTTAEESLVLAKSELGAARLKQEAMRKEATSLMSLRVEPAEDQSAGGIAKHLLSFRQEVDDQSASLLITASPSIAGAAVNLAITLNPAAALIAFDDSQGKSHADLAKQLDAMGYLVLVSEYHPRLRAKDPPAFWRVAAYPFVSDLPWASGRLLALPSNTSMGYLKHLLLKTGQQLAFEDEDDPALLAMEIWADAKAPDPSLILASAAAPGDVWLREAFTVNGTTPDGLVRMEETDKIRVHRTYVSGDVPAGSPLTFSVDCAQDGRRFVTLWLSDGKNKSRAEAIFDLDMGQVVSASSHLGERSAKVEAHCVRNGQASDGRAIYRLWMSVSNYPHPETVNGQLLTRSSVRGGRQHQGVPGRGLLARRMLLELTPHPSKGSLWR